MPLTGTIHVEAAVSDCVSAAGLLHHVETDGLVRGAAGRQSQAGHPAVGRALLALSLPTLQQLHQLLQRDLTEDRILSESLEELVNSGDTPVRVSAFDH